MCAKETTKHDVQMEDRYIRRKCPNHTARYSNILTTVSALGYASE